MKPVFEYLDYRTYPMKNERKCTATSLTAFLSRNTTNDLTIGKFARAVTVPVSEGSRVVSSARRKIPTGCACVI